MPYEQHEDTGTHAEVPDDEQLDADGGEGSTAGVADADTGDLTDVYDDPGEIVEEVLA